MDVFTVAERDARNVLNEQEDSEAIARGLANAFDLEATILTRGTDPVIAATQDNVYVQPTFDSTNAHPVGTGDSFVGGFLSQYLTDGDISQALEYAAATAAFKRTIPGDIAVLTPGDVEAVIDGGPGSISR